MRTAVNAFALILVAELAVMAYVIAAALVVRGVLRWFERWRAERAETLPRIHLMSPVDYVLRRPTQAPAPAPPASFAEEPTEPHVFVYTPPPRWAEFDDDEKTQPWKPVA